MSVGDEMSNERNREIANDSYYRLKWLLAAVQQFLDKLDKAYPAPSFHQVLEWTESLRKELSR